VLERIVRHESNHNQDEQNQLHNPDQDVQSQNQDVKFHGLCNKPIMTHYTPNYLIHFHYTPYLTNIHYLTS
jgi:hypothetical protein